MLRTQQRVGGLGTRQLKDGRIMSEMEFDKIFGVLKDAKGNVIDVHSNTTYPKRHPQLEGQFLKEKFDDDYVIKTSARCFPLGADGVTRLWDRHRCNAAEKMSNTQKYAKNIIDYGVDADARSKLLASQETLPSGEEKTYYISGGTLMARSYYEAMETEPDNKYVKAIKENGVWPVSIVAEETPYDALVWGKERYNLNQDGQSYSFPDSMTASQTVFAEWLQHLENLQYSRADFKKSTKKLADNLKDQEYEHDTEDYALSKWLNKHHRGKYMNPQELFKFKAMAKKFHDVDVVVSMATHMQNRMELGDADVAQNPTSRSSILMALNACTMKVFMGIFRGAWGKEVLEDVLRATSLFFFPTFNTVRDARGQRHPWWK